MDLLENKLRGLDLFSGIGGISEALDPWVRTVAYCERERFPQGVLLSRMERGEIDTAPIHDDVTQLTADVLTEAGIEDIDIITGGFPCQDISVAGKQVGFSGERSSLFHEIIRLAQELRPRFLFLENVPALLNVDGGRVLGVVLAELAEAGYDTRYGILSAFDMGAPHQRDRWWLLASDTGHNAGGSELEQQQKERPEELTRCGKNRLDASDVAHSESNGTGRASGTICETDGGQGGALSRKFEQSSEDVADTESEQNRRIFEPRIQPDLRRRGEDVPDSNVEGLERGENSGGVGSGRSQREQQPPRQGERYGGSYWSIEPDVGRVVNGLPDRAHRLKSLGNSVVPQTAREAFKRLIGWED